MLLVYSYKFHAQQCMMCYTKGYHVRAYMILMIHALKPSDQLAHTNLAVEMLVGTDTSPDFPCQVRFLDKVMFHVNQSKSKCHV